MTQGLDQFLGEKHIALPICACQVNAQATHFGGEQEHKDFLVGVEVIDQACSEGNWGGAVHAVVAVARPLDTPLQDVQHLLSLSEQQGSVTLLLPMIQHLQ